MLHKFTMNPTSPLTTDWVTCLSSKEICTYRKVCTYKRVIYSAAHKYRPPPLQALPAHGVHPLWLVSIHIILGHDIWKTDLETKDSRNAGSVHRERERERERESRQQNKPRSSHLYATNWVWLSAMVGPEKLLVATVSSSIELVDHKIVC